MSDEILSPSGFEAAEPIQDGDVQEIYQPTSLGIRRNKQTTIGALKTFFQKLTTFTSGNIIEADGSGRPRTTAISTASVSSNISHTNANTDNIAANIDQPVKSTSTVTFVDVIITGLGEIKAVIQSLITKTPQSYKPTDNVVFNSMNTGAGAFETVKFPIGAWNMTTDTYKTIEYVFPDILKIISLNTVIHSEGSIEVWDINHAGSGGARVHSAGVKLYRTPGGSFSLGGFSDTGINRGFVTITYTS